MLRDSHSRPRRHHRTGHVVTAAVACLVVAAPVALALRLGSGAPIDSPSQAGGRAWVASPEQATVSLIDGSSQEVVVTVPAPDSLAGDDLTVTQTGSSAYVVDRTLGTAARIDGATFEVSEPTALAAPAGRLQVLEGGGSVYVLDPQRRTAALVDPLALDDGTELSLAAEPGPGQAVVDDAGRLWVVDSTTGSLTWFDDGKHVDDSLGLPDAQLVLVQGQAVLVDVAGGRTVRLGPDGPEGRWSCTGPAPVGSARLLGSLSSAHVYSAVPADGTLVVAAVGRDDCRTTVTLAEPGTAEFGPLAQDGRYVFVPDRTTGTTSVVDTTSGTLVADLPLSSAGHRVELTAKDGIVFYNDLDSQVAGVLTLDGGSWVADPVQKYDPETDESVAAVGADGRTERQQDTGPSPIEDWSTVPPERDGSTAQVAPSTAVAGGPVIAGVRARPDPMVLGSPVRFEVRARGTVGTTWDWTLTRPDGSVAWSSDQAGSVEVTIEDSLPTTYRLSLVVVDAAGHRATSERDLDAVLVPTPHIESFQVEDRGPGLGEVTNISAVESGLSEAPATWLWTVSLDGIDLPFPVQPAPGDPLPMQFGYPGTYKVTLAIESGGLSDVASVRVTYADRCVPALADRRFVDLRSEGAATVPVVTDECFVDAPVVLELPPWLSTTTPTVVVPAGRTEKVDGLQHTFPPDPVPVELRVVGAPPADGLVRGAVTLVLGDERVPVDVRVNTAPAWTADPTCTLDDAERVRFEAPLTDADAGSLVVLLTLDGVPGGPDEGYRMLPTGAQRGVYELLLPADVDRADLTTFTVHATDRFGLESEVRTAPAGECAP